MAVVEKSLPLSYHSKNRVVEYQLDNGHIVLCQCGKLCHVHIEASVACNVYNSLVGIAYLCADGSAQTVAHGAKSA